MTAADGTTDTETIAAARRELERLIADAEKAAPGPWRWNAHARDDIPVLLAALATAEATIERVRALHVPWYEINGIRRDHRVILTAWEPGDLPADHECVVDGLDTCLDDEHYVLACVECRGVTDEGEVGYTLWPCPTRAALGEEPASDAPHGPESGQETLSDHLDGSGAQGGAER